MERKIIFLRPLGSRASPILSHTLFGAVCWALVTLGQDVGAILERFDDGGPRFAFTNAYPYIQAKDGERLLLLPRPPFRVPPDAIEAHPRRPIAERVDRAKEIQGARFISPGVAEQLQNGGWGAAALFDQALQGEVRLHSDTVWLAPELECIWGGKLRKPWEQTIVQRNSVDRIAGATVEGLLFQQTETFYDARRSGLWFGVWADDDVWPIIEGAFRFVADTGLGGKRSVGKGHFEFSAPQDWPCYFSTPSQRQRFLSLSHYIPAAPDETLPQIYDLDVIRQRAENRYPQGEQRVYVAALRAFQPGGLFTAEPAHDQLYGKLLPLGDVGDHTVYYDGLTLPLWGAWEV